MKSLRKNIFSDTMDRKKVRNFILKHILPPALIIIALDTYFYFKNGIIPKIELVEIFKLYFAIFVFWGLFVGLIEYLQMTVGELMEVSWKERVVFIIVVVVMVYLYRATERI